MFTIEIRAGRLLEARVFALANREEAIAYGQAIGRATRSATERLILCADHRPIVVYSQPVADELSDLFVRMNTQLERVAILVARSNATLRMQLSRIVREANNPSRQMFDERTGAEAFLKPALTDQEQARLSAFLTS